MPYTTSQLTVLDRVAVEVPVTSDTAPRLGTGVTADVAAAARASLAGALVRVTDLDDTALLALQFELGALAQTVARHAAAAAGEIARRSTYDRGHTGLAQASGHRTPEALLQAVTGIDAREASRLVKVGSLPSVSPLSQAVTTGAVSVDAADAIRRGLGVASDRVSPQTLDAAARDLLQAADSATPERLYRAAADARTRIDLERVAEREHERRELRYARIRQREDGMVTGSFLLDQEDGRLLVSALDTILSPRRGGPRFVSEAARAAANAIITDPRTNDQLAADALVDIIRVGVDADRGTLFGERRPSVQVTVTVADLESDTGFGSIEGAPEPISIASVRRYACTTGLVGILFSGKGQPLTAAVHRPTTHRPRRPRRRVPVPRLQQTAELLRSPPHQPLASRHRPH